MNVPLGAVSSVVEHYNDTVGVTGSIPVLPTILFRSGNHNYRGIRINRGFWGRGPSWRGPGEFHETGFNP